MDNPQDIGLVSQVSCGASHTLALSEDGRTLWSFGSGDQGKLGHGEMARLYRPKIVESLLGMTMQKVLAGNTISMMLTTEGQVLLIHPSIENESLVKIVILFRCGCGGLGRA